MVPTTLAGTCLCSASRLSKLPAVFSSIWANASARRGRIAADSKGIGAPTVEECEEKDPNKDETNPPPSPSLASSSFPIDKDLKKIVQKSAGTFAPMASTATKNPAVPGTTL